MSHILIEGVSKSFGPAAVLRGCTLSVARGTVTTLLGPSGCGKTTLLRSIAGFVAPDAGRVVVGGRDITALAPSRRGVGYVFQNYALFPHLTVAGNVGYGLRVRRVARAAARDRVARALDLVGLALLADRYPARLSGGQQQRVAIARALVLEPDVLLLDEPFNALDAGLRQAMQVELRKLIDRVGVTAIFVTHDQAEAMALSDTVAVMREGRIEQTGAPLDIYDAPRTAYVAGFIGRANLVPVRVHAGGVEQAPGLVAPGPDGEATLMVRPENLAFGSGPGWDGQVSFATALGAAVEYEVSCGLPEPLRVLLPRRPGDAALPAGAPVRVVLADPAACAILPGQHAS